MPWIRFMKTRILTDNPVLPGTDKFGRPNMDEKYNKKLPEVHDAMRDCGPWQTNTERC